MMRLYSLSLATHSGFSTESIVIDNKLSTLGDWIRFSGLQWYVWTDRTRTSLDAEIKASVVTGHQFIIVAIAPEFAEGIAPQWVWDWMNDKMVKQVMGS